MRRRRKGRGTARAGLVALLMCSFTALGLANGIRKPTYTFVVGVVGGGHDAVELLANAVVPDAAKAAGMDVEIATSSHSPDVEWFTETRLPLHNISEIMRRITSVYGAQKDLIFATNRFPDRLANSIGFGWASHADILTLSRLPANVKFIFLQRSLTAAIASERPPKNSAFPWMARLDTNAIILESYYNGPICAIDQAAGGSRCKVLSIDILDVACSNSLIMVRRESVVAALDVLSWATGVPLQPTTDIVGKSLCTLLQMDYAARLKTLDGSQKLEAKQAAKRSPHTKLHGLQEGIFFDERKCLYPHIAPCDNHTAFSTPPQQPTNKSIRYVFVAGIEGAGHHLVGAMAKAIIWEWKVTYRLLKRFGYRFRNYDPTIFLQGGYPLYSSFSMNQKIPKAWPDQSVFFQAESYPMGSDKLDRHPDLYTFSRVSRGKPVAIFVRRQLGAATLSLLRRYGKRKVIVSKKQPPNTTFTKFNILQKELEVKETSAILVEHSYQELCTGNNPMLECYDLTFEHICSSKASKEQQRAAFIAVASAVGISPTVAKDLDWSKFKSPCKVHGEKKNKTGKTRKSKNAGPPTTPPPPGVPPPPPVSPYDPLALQFVSNFARGRSSVAIHAATPHED